MTFRQNEGREDIADYLDREMAQRESERFWKRYRERYFPPKEKEKDKRRKWFRRRIAKDGIKTDKLD